MLLLAAASLGFVSVAFGAYTEHGLREQVSEEVFRFLMTAIRYNQVHAVIASAVGLAMMSHGVPRRDLLKLTGWTFVVGTTLFSGSIYLSALFEQPAWTALTPVGGVTLMFAWLGLAAFGYLLVGDQRTARKRA